MSEVKGQPNPAVKGTSIDELKKNGSITLNAPTRDELTAKFNDLKASAKDVTLMTGAVGQKDDGTFIMQVDIIKD